MGDTEDGSYTASQLGGYIRREEARKLGGGGMVIKKDDRKQFQINMDVTKGNSDEVVKAGTLVWLRATRFADGDSEPMALVSLTKTGQGFAIPLARLNLMPVGVNR